MRAEQFMAQVRMAARAHRQILGFIQATVALDRQAPIVESAARLVPVLEREKAAQVGSDTEKAAAKEATEAAKEERAENAAHSAPASGTHAVRAGAKAPEEAVKEALARAAGMSASTGALAWAEHLSHP